MTLHYASNRVQGYQYRITVPASGGNVVNILEVIVVRLTIAGRSYQNVLPPAPYQTTSFVWDGYDYLGRVVTDPVTAEAHIGFVYEGIPVGPNRGFGPAFG